MARTRRLSEPHKPMYEASAVYGYGSPALRPRPGIPTWMWGCVLLSMLSCMGICVISMVATPIVFHLLAPEYQAAVIRHVPFMSIFSSESQSAALPTIDPARATAAAALLSSPTPNAAGTLTPTLRPTVAFDPLPVQFHVQGAKWVPQTWNNCGPANLSQAAHLLGVDITQQDAANWLKPNHDDANVSPWQIATYTNQFTQLHAIVRVNGNLALLKRLIYSNFSVLIETGLYDKGKPRENQYWLGHYLTVVGWDDSAGFLYGLDSLEANGPNDEGVHEPFGDLDVRWAHFNRTFIVLYPPDQESKVQDILGPSFDEAVNAQQGLDKALQETQANPNNQFAWFNAGSSYVLLKEWQQAAAAYDRSRSVGGGLPWRMLWYQFGLYSAYYHAGEYQQVIDLAKATLSNTPNIEETFYYRGIGYAALGSNDLAMADFQHAIQFNRNFSPAEQAIQELQGGKKPVPHILVIADAE